MNKRFIDGSGNLFELLYVEKDLNAKTSIICKRVSDKELFSFQKKHFYSRFKAV